MRLRREANLLLGKALASMRRMARAFNDYEEDGRHTTVLLHLQHAFEMLLKAGLVQNQVTVFDKRLGRSIGFDKCVNLATEHINLGDDEAGMLHAISALRDEAQHWIDEVPEGLLYTHCRGAVTLFDRLLREVFAVTLADHLPLRVLPLATEPPRDIQLLIDEQFSQVQTLLAPGKRQRPEARAAIRTLLALEAHNDSGAEDAEDREHTRLRVSNRDVDRVEKAVRDGKGRDEVFPSLAALGTEVGGAGLEVTVRFTKTGGMPVTYVGSEAGVAAGIRERDLRDKYHWSPKPLAEKLQLNTEQAKALRWHLGIEDDPDCYYAFRFGGTQYPCFSDNALRRMRDFMRA